MSTQFHPALKAMSRLVSGRHYDVLDSHAEKFKQPARDFEPRIKNTTTSSNLKKSSYYQAPRRRKKPTQEDLFLETAIAPATGLNEEPDIENINNSATRMKKKDFDSDDEEIPIDEDRNEAKSRHLNNTFLKKEADK